VPEMLFQEWVNVPINPFGTHRFNYMGLNLVRIKSSFPSPRFDDVQDFNGFSVT